MHSWGVRLTWFDCKGVLCLHISRKRFKRLDTHQLELKKKKLRLFIHYLELKQNILTS